ncbi:MAG: hypothetical protein CME62_12895 [Halobacteriovoraceae bacterium]|nr:hypothetical protein [Halobacteriovoraceae bacterium]|tara:strand:+ start:24563 stop:25165 length:603 start_codon:yes stop_codon:yes gene_type:complete
MNITHPKFSWENRYSEEALEHFKSNDFIVFKNFFPAKVLNSLRILAKSHELIELDHTDIEKNVSGIDLRLDTPKGVAAPSLVFGKKEYIDYAAYLTQKNITMFIGRIYFFNSSSNHSWHTDNALGRTLAISINLGLHSYEGGELLIKYRDNSKEMKKIKLDENEIIFFRIDENILHKSNEVQGNSIKSHIAGWFMRKECD